MNEDRLPNIKRAFEDADAAGRMSPSSPVRWLIAEVERLRETVSVLMKAIEEGRQDG